MERNTDCIYNDVCRQKCSSSCIRYLEISYLLEHSNIPKAKQCRHKLQPEQCDIVAYEKLADIQQNIVEFVENDNSLYLWSDNCGNGKTTWSIKFMLQYFNEIWSGNGFRQRAIFINVPTFLSKCKEVMNHPDEQFEKLRQAIPTVDLVVFDDMLVSKLSDYDHSTLLNYTDQRIFNEKTTIFTGNVRPKKLYEVVGDRLASRISSGDIIQLKGLDRRNDRTSSIK